MKRLSRKFFERPTLIVAQELLGKTLVRKLSSGKRVRAKIVETEAYLDESDLASHARFGRTKRSEIMFGGAGRAYIYLIYGMYNCLNIVTEKNDIPGAVLIRAVEVSERKGAGPGKLCRLMEIDRKLNGEDLTKSRELYLEDAEKIPNSMIVKTKRIGVDYAGKYKNKPWRFYIKNNPSVSKH